MASYLKQSNRWPITKGVGNLVNKSKLEFAAKRGKVCTSDPVRIGYRFSSDWTTLSRGFRLVKPGNANSTQV